MATHTRRQDKAAPAAEASQRPGDGPLPSHVAIIMDGNGRWATAHGKSRSEGHRAGYRNVERILERLRVTGVKCVTLFSFSTENWERPEEEVSALMDLLALAIDEQVQKLHRNNVRIVHIGRMDRLRPELQQKIRHAMELTARNAGMTLCLAFDYGGRAEIVQAARKLVSEGARAEDITEESLAGHLYTTGLPDPDLVVRTGGEFRISNFLLWQAAYAEFYSTPSNWPDFDERELDAALAAYGRRERRFGRVR